ncbi:hypothetical protein LGN20_25635 [Burkholderia cepacia]|uniref:hypothetical protein n=1 Tax=Burkholderia cepacia TaxID=292 RepID=UPI001CF2A9A3|nr:hypothetical protein [Burkholderia cepacia]MCA8217291.1 hypothetical protein [Burkholderia cepacia]
MLDEFVAAIHSRNRIRLTFFSKEDGHQLVRRCAPMDYGPSRKAANKANRFHFWDYDSDTSQHTLSLLPAQIVRIDVLDEHFDPAEFVTWPPQWFVERDWGAYS